MGVLGCGVIAGMAFAAPPQYTCLSMGSLSTPSGEITTFTQGNRIIVGRLSTGPTLYAGGKFTDILPIWKNAYGNVYTNDREQFAVGSHPTFAEYRSSLTADPLQLQPQLEFSNQI